MNTLPPGARVHAAGPDEAEDALHTLCAAFGLDADLARPIFYGDPYFDLSHKRLLTLPGVGVVSALTIVPTRLRVGGVPVDCGGVAGVATRPPWQRLGYAGALLSQTVSDLWDDLHYPVSLLHPVSAPFYRQFGWEFATHDFLWQAVPAALPQHAEAVHVRPAREADWPSICELASKLTAADTGAFARDERRWDLIRLPLPGREAYVYDAGAGITGYALWERGETLTVLEMHGQTGDVRRGLAGSLASQPEPLVRWHAAPSLLSAFALPPAADPPTPGVMLRLVDLFGAVSAVHERLYGAVLRDAGLTLTLRASDPVRAANTSPVRLTGAGVEAGSPRDRPWLRADIRILAQLYLGYQTPSEAHALGLIACDSPETLALADHLFPARVPVIAPLDQV